MSTEPDKSKQEELAEEKEEEKQELSDDELEDVAGGAKRSKPGDTQPM